MDSSESESVSGWINLWAKGHDRAADALCQRYHERLSRAVRRKLGAIPLRTMDEEDISWAALDCVLRGIREQKFAEVTNRVALWRLMVSVAIAKLRDHQRREMAQKRGGGTRQANSAAPRTADEPVGNLDEIPGRQPSPQFMAELSDMCNVLLQQLSDPVLQKTTLLKLEGYTNEEIARQMNVSLATVERRLKRIRENWCENARDLLPPS